MKSVNNSSAEDDKDEDKNEVEDVEDGNENEIEDMEYCDLQSDTSQIEEEPIDESAIENQRSSEEIMEIDFENY